MIKIRERSKTILLYLLDLKRPITITSLALKFNVSIRTMRSDIKEIDQYLNDNYLNKIARFRSKGLQINQDKKKIKELLFEETELDYLTNKERWFDLILSVSFSKEPIYPYQKEKELQISRTTLYEDLKKIRCILNKYNVNISGGEKRGILLIGEERNIRAMLFDVLTQYLITNSVFERITYKYIPKDILYQELNELYNQSFNHKNTEIDLLYKQYFIIFTAIWLFRIKSANFLEESLPSEKKILVQNKIVESVHCYIEKIKQNYNISIKKNTEKNYLTFIYTTLNMNNKEQWVNGDWLQAQLVTLELIQYVSKVTKIPFTHNSIEEILYEKLYQQIEGVFARSKVGLHVINPLKVTIKKNESELFTAIEFFAKNRFKLMTNLTMNEDEIAFLTIYFSAYKYSLLKNEEFYYKVAIVCDSGFAVTEFLSEYLKNCFNLKVILVISSEKLALLDQVEIDLIFSTVPINDSKKPILIIEPLVDEKGKESIHKFLLQNKTLKRLSIPKKDATTFFLTVIEAINISNGEVSPSLYAKLEQIFSKNNQLVNKEVLQPTMEKILQDTNIFLNIKATELQEVLKKLICPLIHNASIESMAVASKIYNDYKIVDKHILLVHVKPTDGVKTLGISIGTSRTGFLFNQKENDPIKLIFCLASIDNYSHLNLMKNIIELIQDKKKVYQLIAQNSIENFKHILFSKSDNIDSD